MLGILDGGLSKTGTLRMQINYNDIVIQGFKV